MSNKDVRKPAPGAKEDFAARQQGEPRVMTDEEFLASLTPSQRAEWAAAGEEFAMRMERNFEAHFEEATLDGVRNALDVCAEFLMQVVKMTAGVLETVEVASLRKIVGGELPLPKTIVLSLKAAGIDVSNPASSISKENTEQEAQSSDWRKRPRGARHPLMVLINYAVQAVRLLQKITAGTHPEAQNLKRKDAEGATVLKIPGMPGM